MGETVSSKIYSGASGLVLPVKNKSQYPPEFQSGTRLTFYASLFSTIEINSSFYKLPLASTVNKWAESVPDYFRFTFKLWREITHQKGLVFNPQDVEAFFARVAHAGEKKGCILIQFPPSITIDYLRQFEHLLGVIGELNEQELWDVAVEFRNKSWYEDDVYGLLRESGSCMVLHDIPASATPQIADEFDKHVYLRFHGPNGGYKGSYPDDFLYEYAQYIKEWQTEGKCVYLYFNNTMGDAVGNLMTINKFLSDY